MHNIRNKLLHGRFHLLDGGYIKKEFVFARLPFLAGKPSFNISSPNVKFL